MKNKSKNKRDDCGIYEELLSDSFDGAAIDINTREHLACCENCRRYLLEITSIHEEALKEPLIEVPKELKQNIMARIKLQESIQLPFYKAAIWATIAIFPLLILISTFSLYELIPSAAFGLSSTLTKTIDIIPQTISSTVQTISSTAAVGREVTVYFSRLIPVPGTGIWSSILTTFLLLTVVVNLILLGKGHNFQLYGERTTINVFM